MNSWLDSKVFQVISKIIIIIAVLLGIVVAIFIQDENPLTRIGFGIATTVGIIIMLALFMFFIMALEAIYLTIRQYIEDKGRKDDTYLLHEDGKFFTQDYKAVKKAVAKAAEAGYEKPQLLLKYLEQYEKKLNDIEKEKAKPLYERLSMAELQKMRKEQPCIADFLDEQIRLKEEAEMAEAFFTYDPGIIYEIWIQWKHGTWMFDTKYGSREVLFRPVPDSFSKLVKGLPNNDAGFKLLFSDRPFLGHQMIILRITEEQNEFRYSVEGKDIRIADALWGNMKPLPDTIYIMICSFEANTEIIGQGRSRREPIRL